MQRPDQTGRLHFYRTPPWLASHSSRKCTIAPDLCLMVLPGGGTPCTGDPGAVPAVGAAEGAEGEAAAPGDRVPPVPGIAEVPETSPMVSSAACLAPKPSSFRERTNSRTASGELAVSNNR